MRACVSGSKSQRAVFHPLTVASLDRLTDDSVAITFDVPDELAEGYRFTPGQHLTLRCDLAGDDVRRNYSICAPATTGPLRVAVKRLPGGVFSSFALEGLRPGDTIEVMTPSGRFTVPLDPAQAKHYCALAAGSGITPVLSILATALEVEPHSRATLVYGNRTSRSIMFLEELADLKDRYLERFCVLHVLSRERQEADLLNGRIDSEKLKVLFDTVVPPETVDDWFLCGPAEMIETGRATLADRGVPAAHIHRELFHVGPVPPKAPVPAGGDAPTAGAAEVTILLDGRASTFALAPSGEPILDAALAVRSDAPYACKNGMCGTCRAKVVEGDVTMDHNYALEDSELAAGFVLACQSHPAAERVTLDFDT
ncbi:MAG: 1,2-phenylacetyl-CoA epoxidase subunit PaaE [Acidimicrobiia bacterium]